MYGTEKDSQDSSESRSVAATIYDWMDSLVLAIVVVILIFTFVFRVVSVSGPSMMNTFLNGDHVIVSDIGYTPKEGDVVILSRNYDNDATLETNGDNTPIIKRVIALGGQWINIDPTTHAVSVGDEVNGQVVYHTLNEPYVSSTTIMGDFTYPRQVPEGDIFVMGDNRAVSEDSRYAAIGKDGFFDTRYVIGHVLVRILPLSRIGVNFSGT